MLHRSTGSEPESSNPELQTTKGSLQSRRSKRRPQTWSLYPGRKGRTMGSLSIGMVLRVNRALGVMVPMCWSLKTVNPKLDATPSKRVRFGVLSSACLPSEFRALRVGWEKGWLGVTHGFPKLPIELEASVRCSCNRRCCCCC